MTEKIVFVTEDMAEDVLALVWQQRSALMGNNRHEAYGALREIVGPLHCLAYGHPDQPTRRLKRYRQQPWRCGRCRTWWITDHFTNYGNYDTGGAWRWVRVEDAPMAGEKAEA